MLNSPVGVVTDLDGTVVFGGVADPRLAPFLRRAAGREDISVIVATSRAPRGMAEVLGDAVTCSPGDGSTFQSRVIPDIAKMRGQC